MKNINTKWLASVIDISVYRFTTHRAWVISSFYPSFDAFGMIVVFFVAFEFYDFVGRIVWIPTYNAFRLLIGTQTVLKLGEFSFYKAPQHLDRSS
jgi:hypothetical protein